MADTPNASGEPDELYLDAAATEPVTRNVIEAMMPFMTDAYANPASVHQPGKTAARALDAARASFAAGLGARPDDVIFTSGGTESDNLAIKGIAMARMRALGLQPVYGLAGIDDEPSGVNPAQAGEHPVIRCPRIIISSIEHPAVAQSAQWLHEWFGFEVVHIPVDGQAHLDLDALEQELDGEAGERTTLVSAILANNEVGTVEPVEELVRIAHAHGVPIHVDAVQVRYAQGTGGAAGPRSNPDRAGAFRRRSGARAALRHAERGRCGGARHRAQRVEHAHGGAVPGADGFPRHAD